MKNVEDDEHKKKIKKKKIRKQNLGMDFTNLWIKLKKVPDLCSKETFCFPWM